MLQGYLCLGNRNLTQNFGYINGVDNDHRTGILKADVSSVSPLSERIEELRVVCSFCSRVGATLLVVTCEKQEYIS